MAGTTVTLNGSASTDSNGDTLTYQWTLVSKPTGSAATLSSSTAVTPTLTADVAGSYEFSLVVNDGQVSSAGSTITVTAAVANAAPVANAGAAQNVTTGTVVTLDGSASSDANGDALTYAWTLTGKPSESAAALVSASSAQPTYTADVAGTYVVSLVVNDGRVNSANTATVSVTATVANAAPVANAGAAQNVITGSAVTLDGSASSDANGDALTYSWTLTSRPTGSAAALSSTTSTRPTLTADVAGTYVASLVVNDGRVSSSNAATVSVTATVANAAPVANAGTAQNVTTGSAVTLDGSASSDANGDALSYSWSLTGRPAGSTAALSSTTTTRPTFTADVAGTYVASLVVNDGRVSSSNTATVTVTGITPTLSLYTVPSGLFGGTPTLLSFPYTSSAAVAASSVCVGASCPTTYKVASFSLTNSVLGSFTISGVSATNLTTGSSVIPSFVGLASGQVIGAGQSVPFDLASTFTGGQTVNLRYSFTVSETGQTFTYNVSLRTN